MLAEDRQDQYAVRMHGEQETSLAPRITWAVLHLLMVLVAAVLLIDRARLGMGDSGISADPLRRAILLAFGVTLWGRMTLTGLYLLRRRFGWDEFWPVLMAAAIYQIGFAWLGAYSSESLGVSDVLGIGLYILGSLLNTCSEWQRKRFKDDASNNGRLYTGGLFRVSRHVNYLGDSLWATGWAILTANLWSALIPLLLTAGFIFYFIPVLSRHLYTRYGQQYDQWVKHSWAFIPFVY